MSKVILVDLDNIYIKDEKPSVSLLQDRLEVIAKFCKNYICFGNVYTKDFLKSNNIKVPKMYISKIMNDSADHMIIHKLGYYLNNYAKVSVVTNDKTLIKLAGFIHKKPITFYVFNNLDLVPLNAQELCFKEKEQLQKFITSYNLYKIRYYT